MQTTRGDATLRDALVIRRGFHALAKSRPDVIGHGVLPICAAHREELRGTARRNVVHRKVLALPCLRLDAGIHLPRRNCAELARGIILPLPSCRRSSPVDVVDDRRVDGPTHIAIASWLSLSEV